MSQFNLNNLNDSEKIVFSCGSYPCYRFGLLHSGRLSGPSLVLAFRY